MSIIPVNALGSFHHEAALAMLAAHAIPGGEALDGGTYRRILTIDGEPALVTITLDPDGVRAAVDPALKAPEPTAAIIRRWFDLDADTTTIDRALAAYSTIGPLIARRPGLRLTGYPDEFEAVTATVIRNSSPWPPRAPSPAALSPPTGPR